ncbi:MAG: hypothetical protein KZQ96_20665 [Candidatus Thiodiazotropha sp. (ex Lucinoma borealis)]|nr:hypothetical protein [Candidatus Thiodiazotropha sp. (ex Lucinoma borealis)]
MAHTDTCSWLYQQAVNLIAARDYTQALICLDKLLALVPDNANAWQQSAFIHQMQGMPKKAVEDISMAIEHNPDVARHYWERGALRSYLLARSPCLPPERRGQKLELIEKDYRSALKLDPASPQVWLDLVELRIITSEYDDAVALYGSCRPHMETRKHQLIHAWMGCIALVLSGETPGREDEDPLHNQTIRLMKTDWRTTEISRFLREQEITQNHSVRIKMAMATHALFLSHYHETPW